MINFKALAATALIATTALIAAPKAEAGLAEGFRTQNQQHANANQVCVDTHFNTHGQYTQFNSTRNEGTRYGVNGDTIKVTRVWMETEHRLSCEVGTHSFQPFSVSNLKNAGVFQYAVEGNSIVEYHKGGISGNISREVVGIGF